MKYCYFCFRRDGTVKAITVEKRVLYVCYKCALQLYEELGDYLTAHRHLQALREWARQEGIVA